MTTHDTPAHAGYEPDEFRSPYALWAVPFSMILLVVFVIVISLWVPATASKEMRAKELAGAEASRTGYLEHNEEDADELGNIKESMEAVVRESSNR